MKILSSLLLVAVPLAALGQEVPGLDLSAPPKPREERPAPPPAGADKEKDKAKPQAGSLESALGAPGERDAALGDRVKAVQRKGFLKRHRLQLTALFTPSVNDAFYQKFGVGGRLAYNIAESFAVGVRYAYYGQKLTMQTQYKKEAAFAFQSLLLTSAPYSDLMAEGIWSPVYGKVSVLGQSIVHFDLYLVAGLGAGWSATSSANGTPGTPGYREGEGPHLATEIGGGIRFYPKSWLALDFGLLGIFYPDQTDKAVPAMAQKVVAASFGVTVFYPFGFEYVYP